ncbi:hypothetical protein Poli38472_000356 [Pythium oligandrum]|uniref:Uncharacterized protein n=1 Tax=Pythium oligandrum TaxID=41045 RepID=A0A8K1FGS3_PYTOL|nr:hypothetical protein Poli38472_000356 [Pythium oligandrum]|eukprot:TMW60314.1 hypothetical protein Poli38472_000356 [Pythium oligandrum]
MSVSVAAESTKTTESAASESTTPTPTERATDMLVDEFHGKRVRKSFGTRAFWGTILGGYLVGRAMFYKVGFDDGDVDVFAADEVLYDMKEAELFKKEDASAPEPTSPNSVDQSEQQSYRELIRHKKNLKRRREESIDDDAPRGDWEVTLWGTRLYASIVDLDGLIYINELARTANGGKGEMESTGKVKVGDIIVAVQGRSAIQASGRSIISSC